MKTNNNIIINIFLMLSFILLLVSCKKENSAQTSSVTTASAAALKAIAEGVSVSSNDSIYVIGTCARDHHLDSVSLQACRRQ